MKINFYGLKAIYLHEMDRFRRTLGQSLLSPVISTSLYFIVFGSVIGGYVQTVSGGFRRSSRIPVRRHANSNQRVAGCQWHQSDPPSSGVPFCSGSRSVSGLIIGAGEQEALTKQVLGKHSQGQCLAKHEIPIHSKKELCTGR